MWQSAVCRVIIIILRTHAFHATPVDWVLAMGLLKFKVRSPFLSLVHILTRTKITLLGLIHPSIHSSPLIRGQQRCMLAGNQIPMLWVRRRPLYHWAMPNQNCMSAALHCYNLVLMCTCWIKIQKMVQFFSICIIDFIQCIKNTLDQNPVLCYTTEEKKFTEFYNYANHSSYFWAWQRSVSTIRTQIRCTKV